MYQTRCEGQLSSKQNLNRNLFQTNSKRNLYQRIFFIWKNMPTQKSLKRNLYEKNIWREISPQKKCSNNLSSKNSTKLWGDILCQKKMKTNLYQTIVQAAFPCKIMKKISTKKIGKTISTKNQKKTSPPKKSAHNHGKKHGKIQNWWDLGNTFFFSESSSLSILAIFQLIQFDFCWRRFLLNVFWWQKHVLRFPGVCMFLFFPFFASYFPNLHVF